MKAIIGIKRPEGNVELVDVSSRFPNGISDQLFAAIKDATAKAGRGQVLRIVEGWMDQNPKVVCARLPWGYRSQQQEEHNRMMRDDQE